LGDRGVFTGFAWTQKAEHNASPGLQRVYVKDGDRFKLHTLDAASNSEFIYAVGTINFMTKTLVFEAADLAIKWGMRRDNAESTATIITS